MWIPVDAGKFAIATHWLKSFAPGIIRSELSRISMFSQQELEASSTRVTSNPNRDVNTTSISNICPLREDDENNIPCKFDKHCEPEIIVGRMLTNFNMVNVSTGQSCPIVQLGDLAKIRGKNKRLVRCEGSIVATPLKSSIPPLLTKVEWEALLLGLCKSYKEGHE